MNKDMIVAIDDLYVVAYKKAGHSCTSDHTEGDDLQTQLEGELKQPLHIITRIDKPVSGLVLYARNAGAATTFTEMVKAQKIKKKYLAIVEGTVEKEQDTLSHTLIKGKNNKAYANEDGKPATLSFQKRYTYDKYTLLEIETQTGRFHQIRCQLSLTKHSIKGDVKYGARRGNPDRSIHLHAYSIDFTHPFTQEEVHLSCLPNTEDTLWRIAMENMPS